MAIDSHTHINNLVLGNIENEIKRINENKDLELVINVGMDIETSKESSEISKNNPKFYSSIGIHPLNTRNNDPEKLVKLLDNKKIVAIGEIGIDTKLPNIEEQKDYLTRQIGIANAYHLPVIIHSSNANEMILDLFKRNIKPKYGCVFHCFQPDLDILDRIIGKEYYVSFAGKITYKNAKKSHEVIKRVPNDLYLVETDSPFITPEPKIEEDNHSDNIKYIIQKVSEIKNKSYQEIEEETANNAKRLFKIKKG